MAELREPTWRAGAHKWRGRVAWATRVHADAWVAPRGRGAGRWRAHGLVGLGESIGAITQMHYAFLPFILTLSHSFFRVGLSSHEFICCRRHGSIVSVGWESFDIMLVDRVDRSPPDRHQNTCEILNRWSRKWNPTVEMRSHVKLLVEMWRHREGPIFIRRVKQVEDVGSCPLFMGNVDALRASGLHRTGETSGDRMTENQWLQDRGWRLRDRGSPNHSDTWTHLDADIEIGRREKVRWWDRGPRLSCDRGPRSSCDQGQELTLTGSNDPDFSWEFLFKNWCSSLLFSTFDRFAKELCKFEGRSRVHHDSPTFRFNRDPIGAGFVMINCWIGSNFPLERRTSADEAFCAAVKSHKCR